MKLKKNKILITGTAGFIGFHLVKKLIEKDKWDIVGLDNINDYYDVNLKYARLKESGIRKNKINYNKFVVSEKNENYRFIKLDLKDTENILTLFKNEKFDYVVNLAAQAGVRYSLENPHTYIDSNVYGFLNILEACRYFPVKHLIFASSSSVYGLNKKYPFSENDNVDNPISLYAATKKSNELMAHSYSHLYNIPITGLRFFTVYGPWGRPDMAYFKFAKKIIENKKIDVYNHGKMERDFTYIDDIIEGINNLLRKIDTAALENKSAINHNLNIYNIGNNKPVCLEDFIKLLEKYIGKDSIKNYMPMQPGDVEKTFADITLLENEINFKPETDLEKGLKIFVNWFKNYYKKK